MSTHFNVVASVRKLLCAALFACYVHSGTADDIVFRAEGNVAFTQFMQDEQSITESRYFSLQVNGCAYSLLLSNLSAEVSDYDEVAYDRTNLFFLVSLENAIARTVRTNDDLRRRMANANVANGLLFKGPILHHSEAHEAGPIWLALASGSCLKSWTNKTLEGVLAFDAAGVVLPESIRLQRSQLETQADGLGLPVRAIYFDSGVLPKGMRWPAPYSVGFTSAVYSVREFIEVNGISFPAYATLDVYYPKLKPKGKSNDDLKLACTYAIHVRTVEVLSTARAIMPPTLPGLTTFVDKRFPERAGVVSLPSGREWPTYSATNSREFNNVVAAKLRASQSQMNSAPSRMLPTIVLFCLIFCLPFLAFFWKKRTSV